MQIKQVKTGVIAADATGTALFEFTPAVAGTYILRVWHDATGAATDGNGIYDVGETYNDITVTVGAAGALLADQIPNSADATAGDNELAGVKVSSVAVDVVQVSGRTGIQVGFAPLYRLTRNAGVIAANDEVPTMVGKYATIAYSVTNPAGTAVTVVSAQGGATASTSQAVPGLQTPGLTSATADIARTQAISPTTGWPQKGSLVYFSAATAGTYTITAFHDANLDTLVSVGEATTTSTVVIAADALPSITMTTYGQSVSGNAADALDGGIGQLVKISLKNGTIPASLGVSEIMTVSGPTGTVIDNLSKRDAATFKLGMVDNTTANGGFATADSTTVLLTQANFDAAGNAYINIANSTALGGTFTISASISGGTANGVTGTGSHTVLDAALFEPTINPDKATSYTNLTGVAGTGRAAAAAAGDIDFTVPFGTATNVAIGYLVGAGATADSYSALVTDTYGLITGIIGGQYDLKRTVGTTATTATSVISFTLPVPALASTTTGVAATLTLNSTIGGGTGNTVYRVTGATRVGTTSYSNATLDANSLSIRAGVASSNKMTVKLVDQFGIAIANVAVNAAIAGRNAATVIPTLLTDANGLVSYTLADTSTSTVLLSDTVTFTPANGAASTVTINYATYLPAATITMVTDDSASATATGIAGLVRSDIYAEGSLAGAEAGARNVKVTLKDANGATLPAGIPVTFSVAGTGVAILSTHVTLYTDAAGSATSKVYGWENGDRVVTAKAGSVTATGTYYFRQLGTESETRTISATAKGNTVTAKVTDRFGNPIAAAEVVATREGTGTFNGTSSITGTTDAAGTVQFVLSNGTADVTVGFKTRGYGQSFATKGYIDAGITAILAYTAGTVALAEEGVGASFDAAGVNSVTIKGVADTASIDAADAAAEAAAEAIDAANAATDAANLAAEAADAATVAAEEARDAADAATAAVEELATQVATLMAALKAQITTLANTVAKIAKKVKA